MRDFSLFYTVLYQEVLNRFIRIDLTSAKMAFQLQRVCKVFSMTGLGDLLKDSKSIITLRLSHTKATRINVSNSFSQRWSTVTRIRTSRLQAQCFND